MSDKSIKEGLSAIANEILSDVQKEATGFITNAEVRAKETLKIAKEDADQTYKTIIDDALSKALTEKRSAQSLTEVEIRNRVLQTKETLVDEAFNKATSMLREFVGLEGYHEQLMDFVEEGAKKLGGEKLIVGVNSADHDWFSYEALSALSRKLNISLELASEPEPCMGGCKVRTPDGKLLYDNTFENRIQQQKAELRPKVAKILFEQEATDNAR